MTRTRRLARSTAATAAAALALATAATACIDMAPEDDPAEDLGTTAAAIGGLDSPPPLGVIRVRVAGGPLRTGVVVATSGSSALVLTSERWATWQTPASSIELASVSLTGSTRTAPARYVNTTPNRHGAVIQASSSLGTPVARDARPIADQVGKRATCYGYTSATRTAYAEIALGAASGGELAFFVTTGGISVDDLGVPCFSERGLVGFLASFDGFTGTVQHIGSLTTWLDGLRELAAVRDTPGSAMIAIHTRPDAIGTHMCLDVEGGGFASQTAVNQYRCHNGPSQRWWLDYRVESGYPRLVSDASGLCVDVVGDTPASGADLQTFPCHLGANQRFDMSIWTHGGGIKMRPRHALANCISVEGGPSTSTRRAEQRTCASLQPQHSDQRWYWQFNPPYTP